MQAPIEVRWVRHGRVASHRGDVPLTDEGTQEALETGRRLGTEVRDGESVSFLTTDTRRSRDTAAAMRAGALETLSVQGRDDVRLLPPAQEFAIRNPDLFLAGRRVEMVSTAEAMAEQLCGTGLGATQVARIAFYPEFFDHRDRIGYWLSHPNPPGENAHCVARRLMAFAASLRDVPVEGPHRYMCVTHSPLLRAFLLQYLLDTDPGEPRFMESITVTLDRWVTVRFRDAEKTFDY